MTEWTIENTDEIARTIYLKVPARSIVRLQGYLDLSENLGVLRTVSAEQGLISLLTTKDMLPNCYALLDSLRQELELEPAPAPAPG